MKRGMWTYSAPSCSPKTMCATVRPSNRACRSGYELTGPTWRACARIKAPNALWLHATIRILSRIQTPQRTPPVPHLRITKPLREHNENACAHTRNADQRQNAGNCATWVTRSYVMSKPCSGAPNLASTKCLPTQTEKPCNVRCAESPNVAACCLGRRERNATATINNGDAERSAFGDCHHRRTRCR
jgi:hypothetical protein